MDYSLAKELQDAGFPQPSPPIGELVVNERREQLYLPTLSELIEACGEEFDGVCAMRMAGKVESYVAASWPSNLSKKGTTPEEAVARLWLALNKEVSSKD